jgi:hypothetical protein
MFLTMIVAMGAFPAWSDDLAWPATSAEMRPWAYHWWPGSAVDPANLTKELTRYRDAGMGGVHIVPIYGVKGWEKQYIRYLSPQWMAMLRHAVTEAKRLDLGVDMTTGTGWNFGGPNLPAGYGYGGVKRAAPGGEGKMIDPTYGAAMRLYLKRYADAFAAYDGPKPRAMYHDSFEYPVYGRPPDLDAEFEKRRGYKLDRVALDRAALRGEEKNDRVMRVRSDYSETISEMMVENVFSYWADWCRERGMITRNQAHGAPANLLDLYAVADIPETEVFGGTRGPRHLNKFASSAAHVAGRRLVAAETGTWMNEHFQETLADLKTLADDVFLSGVNHIFYHGTCYSPDEAVWPGWLFYAATEMNPRNAFWRDVPALNAYLARCQSILQSGQPDNAVLLYWPISDCWMTSGLSRFGFDSGGGHAGARALGDGLWRRGYDYDWISDRQLQTLREPRCIVVPPCTYMPLATLARLIELKEKNCTVLFANSLPKDVPGLANLEARRAEFAKWIARVQAGPWEPQLEKAGILREKLVDRAGLCFIRRTGHYFIVNTGKQPLDGWVPLAKPGKAVAIMDPMSGRTGWAAMKDDQVYLQLQPGESVILRTFAEGRASVPAWRYLKPNGAPLELTGKWHVKFLDGGPKLPPSFTIEKLDTWTAQGGEAERFAGTALYTFSFDAPVPSPAILDLGKVCESARVRLNGKNLGTRIGPPYELIADNLKTTANTLEVEVTNLSANRIRDLDRRKVAWKIFQDINFVNRHYAPFDASNWPVRDSGLLGPVRLTPARETSAP